VGIAQAIVHRPKLLVLDEPITGLDPVQIVEMRELLRSLKGDHTILLSSHILSEISETCDRILVIKDGQIAAAGTEAELTGRLRGRFGVEITVTRDAAPKGGSADPGYREHAGTASRARAIALAIEGVRAVDELPAAEPGDEVATLRIDTDRDVRLELGRALIKEGLGILRVGPGERELESAFLELATPNQAEKATGKRGKRRKKDGAAKPTTQAAAAKNENEDGGGS
jgi:ABC-2 type transport system ATP-binding protein